MPSTNYNTQLLENLLKQVSRSFYLSIRILPRSIRIPIGCAYLLARSADTITDTNIIVPEKRLYYLTMLQNQLVHSSNTSRYQIEDKDITQEILFPAEWQLLNSIPEQVTLYLNLQNEDKQDVKNVVNTLIQAMLFDIKTFQHSSKKSITAISTAGELDHYLYQIAGCVGEFWTCICYRHIQNLNRWNLPIQSNLGIRFGKALQLTNILRDVAHDLKIGRCYISKDDLQFVGLTPELILSGTERAKIVQLLQLKVRTTVECYISALDYVLSIPRRNLRLRLATLWPQLIGLQTLNIILSDPNWPNPNYASKVSRTWVYRMLFFSVFMAPSSYLIKIVMTRMQRRIECKLRHS